MLYLLLTSSKNVEDVLRRQKVLLSEHSLRSYRLCYIWEQLGVLRGIIVCQMRYGIDKLDESSLEDIIQFLYHLYVFSLELVNEVLDNLAKVSHEFETQS